MSRIGLPDCFKLAINWKNSKASQFFNMTSSQFFFWRCFISLVKFSYLSKFHVNIITDSGIMTISFYKGLTRNPNIGNTPVWVLLKIWRLEWVKYTKLDTNNSNNILQNVRVAAFTVSGLLKKNQHWVKLPSPLTQIRIKMVIEFL